MDPLLEMTMPRARKPRVRARRDPRAPTRFERWIWSEIPAFRLGLTLGYIGSVYFGVSALVAGVPAFTLAAPEGWTPIWASLLILGGIIATIGSVTDSTRYRRIELAGSWALFLTFGVYAITVLFIAYSIGDATRAAAGSGFVLLGIQPGIRMLWLMARELRLPNTKGE